MTGCQIGQMPQFRVLIGASKPCCLQLACLCPIAFLDLAWHALLWPAPPPRPKCATRDVRVTLTRFMHDSFSACVNVCVGRSVNFVPTAPSVQGISLFTSPLAVPRNYESHLRSPTGMWSAEADGYKSGDSSAPRPNQNTEHLKLIKKA